MPMPMPMPIVNPIHAREGEVVDIYWRLHDGRVHVERQSCPPLEVLKAREASLTLDPEGSER